MNKKFREGSSPTRIAFLCVLPLIYLSMSAATLASPEPTLWDHNGSVVYLVANGSSREFYYKDPRPGMLQAGAQPGSLLFRGQTANGQYFGTAFIFNPHCGQSPYQVSGPILNNSERVLLKGQAPRIGPDCRIQGYLNDTLEFTLLKSGEITTHSSGLLPPDFRGAWMSHSGDGFDITGIGITARSYHEPGYNCNVEKVNKSADTADMNTDVYLVEMMCNFDGENPGPPERAREVWAMRTINGERILIIASTFSIHALQHAR